MESKQPQLVSVQVGQPETHRHHNKEWTSGIFKSPVAGRVALGLTNLDGDRQANLKHHGGPDKAVCCFPAEHYAYWHTEFGLGPAFTYGAFGENFTVMDLLEDDVYLGDVYAVGSVHVQVCQARIPCANLSKKWDRKEIPDRMMEIGHTGYYLRVVQQGEVGAGDPITLVRRSQSEFTIGTLNRAMYQKIGDEALFDRLVHLPGLAKAGRNALRYLLSR